MNLNNVLKAALMQSVPQLQEYGIEPNLPTNDLESYVDIKQPFNNTPFWRNVKPKKHRKS